jgi:hypothetical protein
MTFSFLVRNQKIGQLGCLLCVLAMAGVADAQELEKPTPLSPLPDSEGTGPYPEFSVQHNGPGPLIGLEYVVYDSQPAPEKLFSWIARSAAPQCASAMPGFPELVEGNTYLWSVRAIDDSDPKVKRKSAWNSFVVIVADGNAHCGPQSLTPVLSRPPNGINVLNLRSTLFQADSQSEGPPAIKWQYEAYVVDRADKSKLLDKWVTKDATHRHHWKGLPRQSLPGAGLKITWRVREKHDENPGDSDSPDHQNWGPWSSSSHFISGTEPPWIANPSLSPGLWRLP